MNTTHRDDFRNVVDSAIQTLAGNPVLSCENFMQIVRNILYPHLKEQGENRPHNLMNELQTSIAKPLQRLNMDLPPVASTIDEKQRVADLVAVIFGEVSAHFARKRLVGERPRDRTQPEAVF